MAKLTYRGVAVVVPEGEAVEALIDRIDDAGLGRRLLRSLNPEALRAWRKLVTRLYLAGLQDGIDRVIELDPAGESPAPEVGTSPDETPVALRDLRAECGRDVRSPVQAVVDRYRRSVLKLPRLSDAVVRLNRLLCDPDHDFEAVIAVLERESGLAQKVLALAASSLYARGGRAPRSLTEAALRIGARELSRFLLATGNKPLFGIGGEGRQTDRVGLWHHGLATALMAEILAGELDGAHPAAHFLHGLVHDIGRGVLMRIFDDIEAEAPDEQPFSRDEVARTIDGLHGQFGAALLQKLRFDESYAEVALFHHQPHKAFAHRELVHAVALADLLVDRLGFGGDHQPWVGDDLTEHPSARALGVGADILDYASRRLKREFEQLVAVV